MDRRRFLAGIGGAFAAPGLLRADLSEERGPAPDPRSGSGLPSPLLSPTGLHLYTVRELMAEDVTATLELVAGIGYDEVEFAGYFDRDPGSLRTVLADLDLAAPSAHVGFPDPEAFAAELDAARTLGHRHVVVPWLPEARRRSLDDYRAVADRLSRMGERAAAREIRLVYHNHDFEFEPVPPKAGAPGPAPGDPLPFDLLLERTDPGLVAFQADLFWMRSGGVDPLRYFDRWPDRFVSVHVKDMDSGGRMVPVGDGVMDFGTLLAAAREAGATHYFVEHDRPADPERAIERSHAHLARLELPSPPVR